MRGLSSSCLFFLVWFGRLTIGRAFAPSILSRTSNALYEPSCKASRVPWQYPWRLCAVEQDESSREEEAENPVRFFLDIAVQDREIGRLVFVLPYPKSLFALHTENLLKIVTQERRSIDPQCHYIKCQFNYSPQFVQGLAQYRWAHVLVGRGRNAIGRPAERIVDTASLQAHTHKLYGGIYYGLNNNDILNDLLPAMYGTNADILSTPLLTLPMTGPGRGFTQFSIVRVAESPKEWRERLLLNSAVVGWLEPSTLPVLQRFTRNGHTTSRYKIAEIVKAYE